VAQAVGPNDDDDDDDLKNAIQRRGDVVTPEAVEDEELSISGMDSAAAGDE
jgi:hypothetical protein